MSRRARLSVAGVPWPIIKRDNNRAVCFHAEADYRRYLDDLTEQSRQGGAAETNFGADDPTIKYMRVYGKRGLSPIIWTTTNVSSNAY